jgi:hypothetical protein
MLAALGSFEDLAHAMLPIGSRLAPRLHRANKPRSVAEEPAPTMDCGENDARAFDRSEERRR